jgi:hypothetical protein
MVSPLVAPLSRLLLPLVFLFGVVAGCADEIPTSPLLQGPPAAAKKPGDAASAAGNASGSSNGSMPTAPTAPSAPAAGTATGAPTLTAMVPDAVTVGTAPQGLDVTVTGKGFVAGTQVDLAGTMLPATVLSATQLAVHVPADRTTASGIFRVTIIAKPGSVSNPLDFTVANPTSVVVTTIAPSSATAGEASPIALTVTGSGFVPTSVVRFNGASLTTTFTSSTQLAATITPSSLVDAGRFGVTVVNGADVASLPVSFDVKAAAVADAGTSSGGGGGGGGGGGSSAGNPVCVYRCADYGYAPGQCYQDWYCIPDGAYAGCLGQTQCL